MRLFLALCTAVIVGVAPVVAQTAKQSPNVERGLKLYGEQKCSMCHSVAGKGNAKGPLDAVGTTRTAEEIRQWLINPQEAAVKAKATRKPPMPSYAKLAKEDVEALTAYLLTLKKKG